MPGVPPSTTRRRLLAGGAGALAAAGGGAWAWRRTTGSPTDYARWAQALRAPFDPNRGLGELVRYASLAANGHNTQPWRFVASAGLLRVQADRTRRTPFVDPDDHHLFVSLGCAAENLAIAGRATGRPGALEFESDDGGRLAWHFGQAAPVADRLFDAIARRQSTRATFDGRPIPARDLDALARAAQEPGVRLVLRTDPAQRAALRDLILAANDAQVAEPAFLDELARWIRFNPASARRLGDGLFSATSGAPALPDAIGRWSLRAFVTARGEREKLARQLASSPVFAVFVGDAADPRHWTSVGRACQRLCLAATALGLKVAFVNQAVEVAALRPALASTIGEAGRRPDLVLRLGYGPSMPLSPRRGEADLLVDGASDA